MLRGAGVAREGAEPAAAARGDDTKLRADARLCVKARARHRVRGYRGKKERKKERPKDISLPSFGGPVRLLKMMSDVVLCDCCAIRVFFCTELSAQYRKSAVQRWCHCAAQRDLLRIVVTIYVK